MEFRAPNIAAESNTKVVEYLTKNLSDPEKGRALLGHLSNELGNAVEAFPDWHPILVLAKQGSNEHVSDLFQLDVYKGIDHTVRFVRGFITCPYSEERADSLLNNVNSVVGLRAFRPEGSLYADNAYPVVVEAEEIELEADGTLRSRDALRWFAQGAIQEAQDSHKAETWWNVRSLILGSPHGARSSLFVNQHTGVHMRKILEVLNNSGIFGPIKEVSLEMLSEKKRKSISETLIRTAVTNWDKDSSEFDFELRGETCKANLRDTWDDGYELSVRVDIGEYDLTVQGHYYVESDSITHIDPRGKRALAEKFI